MARDMLGTVYRWWVDTDSLPERLPHRTTLSRMTVARYALLKDNQLLDLSNAAIISICLTIDGSKRQKPNHDPTGCTYTDPRDGTVNVRLLGDTVKAGKSGASQAAYIHSSLTDAILAKADTIIYDTTSSNTGKNHGLGAELEQLLDHEMGQVECLQHVGSLAQVAFAVRLCGPTPSLHTWANTEPHTIAYLNFIAWLENGNWPAVKEGYLCLWGQKYATRQKPVFTRWEYAYIAATQARTRWQYTGALSVSKTTWSCDDPSGRQHPPA